MQQIELKMTNPNWILRIWRMPYLSSSSYDVTVLLAMGNPVSDGIQKSPITPAISNRTDNEDPVSSLLSSVDQLIANSRPLLSQRAKRPLKAVVSGGYGL